MAKSSIFTLAIGLLVGVMLSFMFAQYESISKKTIGKTLRVHYQTRDYSVGGNSFYLQQRSLSNSTKLPVVDNELTRIVTSFPFDPLFNSTLLKTQARTLCYIMCAKGSQGAIKAAKATVAEHCSKTVFFSRSPIKEVGSIDLGFEEDTAHRWERYKMAADYVYTHYRSDYELFIKLEYDIYIVPENIQFMTLLHQAYIPGYLGHVVTGTDPRGVVTVLTREGLEILHEALPSCPPRIGGTNEGLELEECLKPLHIFGTKESRDYQGTPRFQMLVPDHALPGNTIKYHPWAMKYIHHPLEKGLECCSDYSISFHYVPPNMMYQLEFMVYHMRPFGVGYYMCPAEIRTIIGLPEAQPPAEFVGPLEGEKVKFLEKDEKKKPEQNPEVGKEQESEKKIEIKVNEESEKKKEEKVNEEPEKKAGTKEETKVVVDAKAQDKGEVKS